MSFATPWLLLLFPALAVIAAVRWRHPPRRTALAAADLTRVAEATGGTRSWRIRLRGVPLALRIVAIVLLALALARPQRGLAVTTLPEEGIDVVLALDVSGSMSQRTGLDPRGASSRLSAAQEVIDQFVSGLAGDRVGLVTFRSRAIVMSPLTLDHVALLRTVESLETGLLPDGTAIGLGLAEAVNLLRDSAARSRVIVLLTDGANNAGEVEPLQAARLAEALGIRVYTIGFLGDAAQFGAPPVDASTLRLIAEITGAESYGAGTQEELSRAYATVGALERSRVGERHFTSFQELGPWLGTFALALLVAEGALRASLWRRHP